MRIKKLLMVMIADQRLSLVIVVKKCLPWLSWCHPSASLMSSQCVTLGSSLFHHGHYFMLLESVVH
ncbi:hypothetical protein ACIPPT_05210 [Wolbachia endosymbiont of Drosophila bicornuta]